MAKPKVYKAKWNEDGSAYVLARVMRKNPSQNLVAVQQADLASVTRKVFLVENESTVLGPTTLTISDVILNTLSTGSIWTIDATGFNFIDNVPPAAFPTGDSEYRIEYRFTLTGGEVFWLLVSGTALPVLTS